MNRSMDNLEILNDNELRLRLMQYGFPNVPVTATTKNILIKKLRNCMNNEKAKLRRETKNAIRYSSGEESDIEKKSQHGIRSQILNSSRTSNKYNIMPPPKNTIISRRLTTGVNNNKRNSTEKFIKDKKIRNTVCISPVILSDDTDDDDHDNNLNISNTSTPKYNYNYITPEKISDNSWNQNRVSFYTNSNKNINNTINNGYNKTNDSPYISDFTKRLLNLRGDTIRDSIHNNSHIPSNLYLRNKTKLNNTNPSDIVYQQSEPNNETNISPSIAFSNLLNRLNEQYGVKQTLIPFIILSIFFIFLTTVGFMYMTISPDIVNTISESNTAYEICPNDNLTSGINCILSHDINNSLDVLKIITPQLQKKSEYKHCKNKDGSIIMSVKEAIQLIKEKYPNKSIRKIQYEINNAEYLIDRNPQWKINNVDQNGNLINFNNIINLRDEQKNYYAILNPKLPFLCSLYNKLQKFFLIVGTISLTLITVFIFKIIYKKYFNYKQYKKDLINNMIDDIINHLMRKAAYEPDNSAIIVNHLKNKFIPLHKRSKDEWIWNEAIKYLENNESRIQITIGIRNGEECKLMKWIDTVLPEDIDNVNNIKKWQSPAFDKANKIFKPPTQCLKIRQMFDKSESNNPNLKTIIQDSILEKVGNKCKIYDIQLDKPSCCVYVRCATPQDAGIVHDEINGWWFDKRLVSIKFLRLERYLFRFPKSLSGPNCLRPSNTKNLSMTQCSNEYGYCNGQKDDDETDENI